MPHCFSSLSSSALSTFLLLASASGLLGCSSSMAPAVAATTSGSLSGNWQVSSTAVAANGLPALSGSLTGTEAAVTGIFHAAPSAGCIAANIPIHVAGRVDSNHLLTLRGEIAGGYLTIAGTLADDAKSLTAATYNVSGGSCAFAAQVQATAQSFSPVSGTYNGSFSDAGGQVITLSATLTQTPTSDTSGDYQLSGTGSFPNNPCFSSPVSISNSQVTGGSFSLTYADSTTQNSVTANGTFSSDANTLTITQWSLTGSCGPDSGTGLLTR